MNPYMNNEPGVWYLAAEDAGLRPIMLQRRQAVESQELGPGSQRYFDRKEYSIGQDARYECSYTHPQLMLRVEPT
jgi:phage major head subunit gpT-like protein